MKVGEIIGDKFLTLKAASLISEAFIENPDDPKEKWIVRGRPTDKALLEAGIEFGIDRQREFKKNKIAEIPFNPINKFAAVLYEEPSFASAFVKTFGGQDKLRRAREKFYMFAAPRKKFLKIVI